MQGQRRLITIDRLQLGLDEYGRILGPLAEYAMSKNLNTLYDMRHLRSMLARSDSSSSFP